MACFNALMKKILQILKNTCSTFQVIKDRLFNHPKQAMSPCKADAPAAAAAASSSSAAPMEN